MRMDSTSGLTFNAMKRAGDSDPEIAARVALFEHRVLEELYDFEKDPAGLRNLIADPRYQEELETLRGVLKKLYLPHMFPESFAKPAPRRRVRRYLIFEGETFRWK